jgi:hypothetical protein
MLLQRKRPPGVPTAFSLSGAAARLHALDGFFVGRIDGIVDGVAILGSAVVQLRRLIAERVGFIDLVCGVGREIVELIGLLVIFLDIVAQRVLLLVVVASGEG